MLWWELSKRGGVCRCWTISYLKQRASSRVWDFSTSLIEKKWKKTVLLCFSYIQKALFFCTEPLGEALMQQCRFLQTHCLPESCKSLASVPNSCCFVNQLNAATWREVITSFEARQEDNMRTHWVYLGTAVLINGINAGTCLLTLCKRNNLKLAVVFFFPGYLCRFRLLSWPVTF